MLQERFPAPKRSGKKGGLTSILQAFRRFSLGGADVDRYRGPPTVRFRDPKYIVTVPVAPHAVTRVNVAR